MSMEKDKIAYEQLLQGIQSYVNKCLGESNRDITTTGKIVEVVKDGCYTVEINGVQYSDIYTIGGKCTLNEMVRVVIPQGQYDNMFILKGIDFDQIYPIGSVYMSTEIINPATLFGGIWEQIKNNNISAVYMWKRTN